MDKIEYWVQIIREYILNNNLNVDKATFLTIVIGQITIYGILLTFYQFVASYQGSEIGINRYLGINIKEFFVKKKIKVFNNFISKKGFGIIVILEILYKPFITIYRAVLPIKTISIMNFIWFGFAITYFVLFVIIFYQCTKSVLVIKMLSDAKTQEFVMEDINRIFLKKTVKDRIKYTNIELLRKDFRCLYYAIKDDDNYGLQEKYDKLISFIFEDYRKQKEHEFSLRKKYNIEFKNQKNWIYNTKKEVSLLQEIIDEKYFRVDKENIEKIMNFYLDVCKQNISRAELEGYDQINYNKYISLSLNENNSIFDASGWKEVLLEIYIKMDDERRQSLIHRLYIEICNRQELYASYCDECLKSFITMEVNDIFKEKRKQKDVIDLFGTIINEENFNDYLTEIIRDRIGYYNKIDIEEILKQLSKQNCTYLFTYIVMYYSLYRFQFEWEFFNIKMLRVLWNYHGDMKSDEEAVIQKIKNTNIGHRFEKKMYTKLMEYIDASPNGNLFNTVCKDGILDAFYIWTIKSSVTNSDEVMYCIYQDDYDMASQIAIINEVSKHDELLECQTIAEWLQYMKYKTFVGQTSFPEKLEISLRCLLLTGMHVLVVIAFMREKSYLRADIFGIYILIKINELSHKVQNQDDIKGIVRNAFIARNMNVDEYIDMIERECSICRSEINYVQKEKMKEYLLKTF